jgi:hypothetical protein
LTPKAAPKVLVEAAGVEPILLDTEVWEIQRDLDPFVEYYNLRSSHQAYRLDGRTPAQALRDALGVEELPPFNQEESTTEIEAA